MPNGEGIDYRAVLADLEAKKSKIEAAIEVIRTMVEGGGADGQPSLGPPGAPDLALRSDSFFGMSIPDATEKFLRATKRPQSPPAIARALEQGGYTHSSSNFPNTVRASINRLPGKFVQVGREWGLVEWYPGMRRAKRGGEPREEATDGSAE
ncbi:MAG: hypothetical protein ACREOU_03135 [Candidatus Eiseniibacteriota bacterium]